jgi:hypothetical protein
MPWYIVKYDQGVIERAHVRIEAASPQFAEDAVLDGCGEVLITEIVNSIEMDIENVEVELDTRRDVTRQEIPNPRPLFIILLMVAILALAIMGGCCS